MASHHIHLVPPYLNRQSARLESFPRVANRCQRVRPHGIPLRRVRDQGVPVSTFRPIAVRASRGSSPRTVWLSAPCPVLCIGTRANCSNPSGGAGRRVRRVRTRARASRREVRRLGSRSVALTVSHKTNVRAHAGHMKLRIRVKIREAGLETAVRYLKEIEG